MPVCSAHSLDVQKNHGNRGCHGSDDMVSDSVLSLSVSVSLLMCAPAKERCYYRPLVVVIITAESMAKQYLSQCLRVSLSGPGVILIDYIASSSTACLALCPCTVQHTLYSGRDALTLKCCVI